MASIKSSILAYTAFNYMLEALPASKAGAYPSTNPVVAVILGVLIMREADTVQNIISAAIILSGAVLVQASKVHYVKKVASK